MSYGGSLFPIPSAWEVAHLLIRQQLDYAPQLLNPTHNAPRYTTSDKQALNLGVWAADLSYLNTYHKSQQMVEVLLAVRQMCSALGLEQTLQAALPSTMDSSPEPPPQTFASIISQSFGALGHELAQTDRAHVGALIIAGTWVEGMYMLTQLATTTSNRELINRIGELRQPLANLVDMLSPYYYTSSPIADLVDQLLILQQDFEGVIHTYTYKPATVQPAQRHITINSTSRIVISDYLLADIARHVHDIRTNIVE